MLPRHRVAAKLLPLFLHCRDPAIATDRCVPAAVAANLLPLSFDSATHRFADSVGC